MKKIFFFIFSFLFLFFPLNTFAQESWVIENFQSNIKILQSGKVSVSETINVDFGSVEKHGTYRNIPYIYSSTNGKVYTKIENIDVEMDNSEVKFSTSDNGNNLRIKIGDPNKTISGKHSYKIGYFVTGVLKSYDTYDELYWNVTGNNWEVPILKTSANVHVPSAKILQAKCFEGNFGSTNTCNLNITNSNNAVFKTNNILNMDEGLTIVAGFEKGIVPILTVEPPKSIEDVLFTLTNLVIFLASSAAGVFFAVFIWWKNGRDLWWRVPSIINKDQKEEVMPIGGDETIVVEYEPPENLRPAEIGTLFDERADTLDVTATIIDLATRGYLTIKEVSKKWMFGKTDYILSRKTRNTNNLLDYEKELLNRIFEDGDDVSVSDLKTKFYKDLKHVKDLLYKNIVEKKFFPDDPEKVRIKYLVIGIIFIVFGFFLVILGFINVFPSLVAGGIGFVLSGPFLIIFSQAMPRRTGLGRELLRRIKGYRLFISGAEKYKQQFYEKKNMFNEVLPYAIVFGLTEKFAKAMKDIGIQEKPNWYIGTGHFSAVVFGAHINSFSSSLSSAITAAPKGSGFSSGGGFSGGGFGGGGGGGSW